MKSTLEVLSDSELIDQIKEIREDYNFGKIQEAPRFNERIASQAISPLCLNPA